MEILLVAKDTNDDGTPSTVAGAVVHGVAVVELNVESIYEILSCGFPDGSEGKERVKPVMLPADTPASIVASSLPYVVHHGDNRHKCIGTW
ncbi:hypothetical protein PIB30_047121 [Stylosanthes scabra]|uniref:Uncharacterized protein n=1 Tax=Stylosanthes scabra TaxID=79078 RepID=A0ABU6TGE2_9FABA|nr:hypothetical protein [Stylosanthes scabra]